MDFRNIISLSFRKMCGNLWFNQKSTISFEAEANLFPKETHGKSKIQILNFLFYVSEYVVVWSDWKDALGSK